MNIYEKPVAEIVDFAAESVMDDSVGGGEFGSFTEGFH